jgi:hypothetical protein
MIARKRSDILQDFSETAPTSPAVMDVLDLVISEFIGRRHGNVQASLVIAGEPGAGLVKHARRLAVSTTIITIDRPVPPAAHAQTERYLQGDIRYLLPLLNIDGPAAIISRRSIGWSSFFEATETLSNLREMASGRMLICFELVNNHTDLIPVVERRKAVQARAIRLPERLGDLLGWQGDLCSYDAEDIHLLADVTGFSVGAIHPRPNGRIAVVLWTEGQGGGGSPSRGPMRFSDDYRRIATLKNNRAIAAWAELPFVGPSRE